MDKTFVYFKGKIAFLRNIRKLLYELNYIFMCINHTKIEKQRTFWVKEKNKERIGNPNENSRNYGNYIYYFIIRQTQKLYWSIAWPNKTIPIAWQLRLNLVLCGIYYYYYVTLLSDASRSNFQESLQPMGHAHAHANGYMPAASIANIASYIRNAPVRSVRQIHRNHFIETATFV